MSYLLFLQSLRFHLNGVFDGFFLTVTRLAESPVPYIFLAWVYWCLDKRAGQLMALCTGLACSASQTVKRLFRVDRPWVRFPDLVPVPEALGTATDYSFPSGHVIRSGSAYGVFGLEQLRRREYKSGFACPLLLLLIAFSRNWLGVHTFADVAAGMLVWVAGWLVVGWALAWCEKGGVRDILVCLVFGLLLFLPMLRFGCLSNAGAGFGFLLGWLLERRFIRFSLPQQASDGIARAVFGTLGILLISTVFRASLSPWMPGSYAAFFTNFFLALFIMALYPAVFCWAQAKGKAAAALFLILLIFLLPFLPGFLAGNQPAVAVIGHRGFSSAAPENTIPAFQKALDIGVDYIELDVQLTADREIVVCHDANIGRVTGVDAELGSLTLAELKALDFGSWFSPDYAGTRIPTLREVLELVKPTRTRIYLEMKDIGDDPAFPEAVLQLTEDMGMKKRCIFASFRYDYLQQIKALDPKAKVLFITDISESSLPSDYPADYYGVKYSSFSPELAGAIHKNKAFAFVWTVDDPEQMASAVSMGADGICSNCPDLVLSSLS